MRSFGLGILPFVIWVIGLACDGTDTAPAPGTPPVATPTPSAGGTPSAPAPGLPELAFEQVADGFERPTFVTAAGDGSGRLFVVEKRGTIRIVRDGQVLPAPFLDIRSLVRSSGNEQGLLGLAFHPEFPANGRFFVYYTASNADNTLAEFRVSASDPNRADPASRRVLFAVPDDYANHNGGMLAFGPDGYLYVALGDGGGSGDPLGAGQDRTTLLGKLLRLDVDGAPAPGLAYAIPPDNPFASAGDGVRREIWAYGLRNPWRFSFDRETGDLWIADVGQDDREEVNFEPAGSPGGRNYGWSIMEGTRCYRPSSGCATGGLTLPVFEYTHDDGCSVTGGYVYRGSAIPALRGAYLLADYCTGAAWALRFSGSRLESTRLDDFPGSISSFGEDDAGELYVVRDQEGALYRLEAR